MGDIICGNCNYRFTLKAGKELPARCDYCDTRGSLQKVKSAQDLLDETIPGTFG